MCALLFLGGVAGACAEPAIDVQVTQQRATAEGTSLVVRATDRYTGEQLDVSQTEVELEIDGVWTKVPPRMVQPDDARLSVVLVADNSSDQKALESVIQDAAYDFGDAVFERVEDSRVGLVRVSTQASVVQPLTAKPSEFDVSVNRLSVANGWTALYDGVRLANETLAQGESMLETKPCASPTFRAIVVFTNGSDNNSADEHPTSYQGDGIDTTLDDLKVLSVRGEPTPIFSVGVGKRVDESTLRELARATGGHYAAISSYQKLADELLSSAQRVWDARLLCFEQRATAARVKVVATTELGKTERTVTVRF